LKIINLPIRFQEIEDGGYHLFVQAQVNGKPANLLLDTGASKTVFDNRRIRQLLDLELETDDDAFELSPHKSTGLGTNDMDSYLVELDKLELGDIVLEQFEVVVLPMDHVNEAYRMLEYTEIDGVLGSDILKRFKATVYYGKKLLKLYQSHR
jgi:predicted aspartyl protease